MMSDAPAGYARVAEARTTARSDREAGAGTATRAPFYRTVAGLARDPLAALTEIGSRSGGAVVRVDLGLFRPYLLTHPEHVQHFLVDNADNYRREGLLWTPVRGLLGDGLAGEGAAWENRHDLIQQLFSAKYIASLRDSIVAAADQELDELDCDARAGRPVDIGAVMTRIVNRVVLRAFFGDQISLPDAHRLRDVLLTAFTSLGARMVLPFVPRRVPLPGTGAYRRAARVAQEVLSPPIRHSRQQATAAQCQSAASAGQAAASAGQAGAGEGRAGSGKDLAGILCRARDENGERLDDQRVMDDMVAMFVAGGETAPSALTWLWVLLDRHPAVAARVRGEVDRVVGTQRLDRAHLTGLSYTKMVLQEVLRLYPPGWMLPRRAAGADTIGGVRIKAGSTVIASPYLTQRMPWLWSRPEVFDPDRFAPDAPGHRHRYAYFPFGAGPHSCIGSNFFTVEALIIVAAVLRRYRVSLCDPSAVPALPRVSLRPGRRVEVFLRPVGRP